MLSTDAVWRLLNGKSALVRKVDYQYYLPVSNGIIASYPT